MNSNFPTSPVHGQEFETIPGTLYKYSSITRAWERIIKPTVPLATVNSDGLMSKEDFQKLTGFIIPPPQSTLTAEGCSEVSTGFIGFEGDGIITAVVDTECIHENTGLIKFGLDVNKLIDKLRDLGKLTITIPDGDQGPQGEDGDPGLDALPVGPYGKDGIKGANSEWPGGLVEEQLEIKDDNRAVVEITTEEISAEENYLVVKRANIGNPDACPDTIIPKDVQSPWILCFTPGVGATVRTRSADGKLICSRACSSDIYYFNMDLIIRSVKNRYTAFLNAQKTAKERQATAALERIINVFDDQKAALCCALERVRSKIRNTDARRYIETQKIAAATADASKPAYNITVKTRPEGVVPSFYTSCDYQVISLADPEVPIVDPDNLDSLPVGA